MDDLWLIPAIIISLIIVIFGGMTFSVHEENVTTRLAIINCCENTQTDRSRSPTWTNCKGSVQQPANN